MPRIEVAPIRLRLEQDIPTPDEVVVGKDVLELVTGAMYLEPLSVFREYVQNAADSLDEANLLRSVARDARIEIKIDVGQRRVWIRDNGVGVSNADFVRKMTSIGGSDKRSKEARGFRGVGRLSGLGYCRELIFRSKAAGDKSVFEMTWDGRRFREILRDVSYRGQLSDVVRDVTSTRSMSSAPDEPTFFEVELGGMARIRNDQLLNADVIGQYLSQVAPVAFHDEFDYASMIQMKLAEFGIGSGPRLTICEVGSISSDELVVRRPYQNHFELSQFKADHISGVRFVELPGIEGGVDAVAWIADHGYMGAIPNDQLIRGLRFRSGNIQIGNQDLAADWFPEPRFNSWVIGEIHVLNRKIVPNGRRDNFEDNAHFANLQGNLLPELREASRTCRRKSGTRQWSKRFEGVELEVKEDIKLLANGGLSRRGAARVGKQADDKVIDLEHRVEQDPYGIGRELKTRVTALRRALDAVRERDAPDEEDPLSSVPYTRRLAFQEVLELVYANATNKPVANGIVQRIVKQLAAKYGAK